MCPSGGKGDCWRQSFYRLPALCQCRVLIRCFLIYRTKQKFETLKDAKYAHANKIQNKNNLFLKLQYFDKSRDIFMNF